MDKLSTLVSKRWENANIEPVFGANIRGTMTAERLQRIITKRVIAQVGTRNTRHKMVRKSEADAHGTITAGYGRNTESYTSRNARTF